MAVRQMTCEMIDLADRLRASPSLDETKRYPSALLVELRPLLDAQSPARIGKKRHGLGESGSWETLTRSDPLRGRQMGAISGRDQDGKVNSQWVSRIAGTV